MKPISIIFICILFFAIYPKSFAQTQSSHPNVIFVIVDDLGPAWLPPYAKNLKAADLDQDIIKQYIIRQNASATFNAEKQLEAAKNCMPFLDKLSAKGVKFNHCFTTASLCSPSRAAILTGKYAEGWGVYTLPESVATGIPLNIWSLPTIFQQNGYNTGIIGKWHVAPNDTGPGKGDMAHAQTSAAAGYHPLDRGFNYYYGYNHHSSVYSGADDIWENRTPVPAFKRDGYLIDTLNKKAVAFVQRSVDQQKPFFLYYAPMTMHGRITPCPTKYSDKFNAGVPFTNIFAGHLLALDGGIQQIYQVLEKTGQADNTLFILCSDNGPADAVPPYNAPYKGGKGTGWLGGSHSPLIMVMPGKTKQMFNNDLVSCMDILPTAIDVAGLKIPAGLDGVSLKKLIFEGKQDKPHESLFSSGVHSSKWSYNYFDDVFVSKKDDRKCPLYVWGINDQYYSLHITAAKPGQYDKYPNGMPPQNLMFDYIKDTYTKNDIKTRNSQQSDLDAKTAAWIKKQKNPVRDRKDTHAELVNQLR